MTDNERKLLRLLRSDLDDATNPKILKKYPHLGSTENIEQLKQVIKQLEESE